MTPPLQELEASRVMRPSLTHRLVDAVNARLPVPAVDLSPGSRRRRNLIKLGADPDEVHMASRSRKGYWRMSRN